MPKGLKGFQAGNRIGVGNSYGKANAGKPSKLRGVPHGPDCPHCLKVRSGKRFDRVKWMKEYGKVRRFRRFGITEQQYNDMKASQDGCCAICRRTRKLGRYKNLAIDHCHKTGKVRGLLCVTCNTRLGFLERYWDQIHTYLSK